MIIEKMSVLHERSLDILSAFDALCRDKGLRYYLVYGALIGFIRDGDLIPWDDDIDVAMMRSDYEKLLELQDSELPQGYRMVRPADSETFFDFVPRFICPEYECIRKDVTGLDGSTLVEPLGIDVFVIDERYVGMKHKILVAKMKFTYLQATKFRDCRVKDGFITRTAKKVAALTTRKKLPDLVRKYDEQSKSCKECTGRKYISNTPPPYLTDDFDSEMFGEPQMITIRGRSFPAPKDIGGTLKVTYDDYMTRPPEEKRINDHFQLEMDEHL